MTFRLVIGEPDGRTHFNKLLFRREWPCFYAFDVLSIEGEDLTRIMPTILRMAPFLEPTSSLKRNPACASSRSHRYG